MTDNLSQLEIGSKRGNFPSEEQGSHTTDQPSCPVPQDHQPIVVSTASESIINSKLFLLLAGEIDLDL